MDQNKAPEAAAEIALAVSECMNLLFLFAAPRIFATVRLSGLGGLDSERASASLRRFLHRAADIRARTKVVTGDVERLIQAAILVEEIVGALASVRFEDGLSEPLVERSRRALAVLGFPEPKGGWDTFEGFSIPYPPPPKPAP